MYIWKSTDNSWCIINEWCLFQCSKLTSSITLSFLFFLAYFFPRATQLFEALFYSPIYQWSRKPKCAWTQNQIKILITLVLQLNIQCWPMFIFHLSRLLPLMSIFFNYTNTIFVLYFEFVWWGGLTLPANLLKGPAFHFSDHYMEKLLLIWLESLSDLEYASLWEFKQMKTIYFNSEFSAEVFFFSYYTKFFQNAYVSEMFV